MCALASAIAVCGIRICWICSTDCAGKPCLYVLTGSLDLLATRILMHNAKPQVQHSFVVTYCLPAKTCYAETFLDHG